MHPHISQIFQFLSGEKLEPATKESITYLLSALVVVPLAIVGLVPVTDWLESVLTSPFDNAVTLVLFIMVIGFVVLGAVFSLARICRNHLAFLILLSWAAWGVTTFLMWRPV